MCRRSDCVERQALLIGSQCPLAYKGRLTLTLIIYDRLAWKVLEIATGTA